MALVHDGKVTVALEVRIAWWVGPYLGALNLFAASVAPFIDIDDDRLSAFAQQQAAFIAAHGIRCYVGGKRV